jgi:hypothetical protein
MQDDKEEMLFGLHRHEPGLDKRVGGAKSGAENY